MQPLIFLHGALGSSDYFDNIIQQLSKEYEVYSFKFGGHGYRKVKERISIQAYVAELVYYCKQNNLKDANFFGYSMGGYVALTLAVQHPELVGKIMTLATKYMWTPEIAQKEVHFLDPELIKQKVPKYAEALAKLHGETWEYLVKDIAQLLLDLGDNPLLNSENLAQLEQAVQVMVGDKDNMVGIAETIALAKAIKNSSFAVLPNTIHPFEKVNQALVLQLIRDFF